MKAELQKLFILYKTGKINQLQLFKIMKQLKKKNNKTTHNNEIIYNEMPNNQMQINNKIMHPMIVQHKLHKLKLQNTQKQSLLKEIINDINLNKELPVDDLNLEESKKRFKYHQSILHNDKEIIVEQAKYIKQLCGLSQKEKLIKLSRCGIIKEFKAEHNYSKKVLLLEGFIVRKIIEQTSFGNYLFWNEINALIKLFPYKHFPKLIAYDPNRLVIYMSYCGDMLTPKNLPSDWKEQLATIHTYIKEAKVQSHDMLVRNTCVLNGRINIIDFGLNTQFPTNADNNMQKFYSRIKLLESKKQK